MTKQQRPLAIRRLENAVERVAPREPNRWDARPALQRGRLVSQSRAHQLRATVRQLALAVGHEGMPEGCGRSVQRLLGQEAVDAFLELASEGEFRDPDRTALLGKPLSWSSLATLRDCLVILGEEVGVSVVVPRVWRQPAGQVPSERQAAAVYRRTADMAAEASLDALLARTVALVGVILDTGMQTSGVLSRRLPDVDLEAGEIRAVYRMQNSAHRPAVEAVLPLREGTVVAVKRWLGFRQVLVDELEGSDHGALWVTVQTVSRLVAGVRSKYAAGMPLGVAGFRHSHAQAMEQLNAVLAGRWDQSVRGPWVPLPLTPEGLRRAVDVEALVPEVAAWRGRFDEPVERPPRWAEGPHPGVPSFAVHGRDSTYSNYRCRCEACYREHSRVEAAKRALRKQRQAG